LLAVLDLLVEQHAALDGFVVFGLHVFERGRLVSCLLLEVVVGDFDVAELQCEGAVRVS
jgi:hypothetical protein